MPTFRTLTVLSCVALLAACGGAYEGTNETATAPAPNPNPNPGPTPAANCSKLFTVGVQPRLAFCRSCHVPGGIGDVDNGRKFMLSPTGGDDYDKLTASWVALGKNDAGPSRILLMASGQEPHTGGSPWKTGSDAYKDMDALLKGFADPAACSAGTRPAAEWPLLGSSRGGHAWFDYCEGKPDDTLLPDDPRELVVPGVNQDTAVYMNAYWQTCQTDGSNHPANCGELRARVQRGYPLVASAGQVGAGSFFCGNGHQCANRFSSDVYNSISEKVLRLPERPDNFDQLVAERWGMPLSPTRNPYPLPDEEPNDTDGGSGQLPMGLTQLREPDGTWTGQINVTCSICHGGGVGSSADGEGLGAVYGTNSLSDITAMFTDLAQIAPQQGALAAISQNKVRGTGNITNFQLFGTLTISESMQDRQQFIDYLSIQGEPSTGTEDPPVWWNVGHRPMKFFDAGQAMDSKRIELSFHFPNTPHHPDMAADKQWIIDHQQDSDAWIASRKAPAWPEETLGAIDTAAAERGAILFHSKDLWAPSLGNPAPRPQGGNGSCASCHGAYSPRYVHDTTYLDTPALEGIAAHIVPIEVIGTDSKRLDGNSQRIAETARRNWFAYADGPKNEAGIPLCADWNDTALRGDRPLGYLAPPLYGVWATAPYFHNGSVPNVSEVLKPADRKPIWQRVSNPARADQAGKVVMGYDYSLATGYDADRMGWKYQELACGTGSLPFIECNPVDDDGATIQDALAQVWLRGGLAWNLANPPLMSNEQLEQRKIYNTHYYSQDNSGHDFSAVLTDDERAAIIEYLKTL